jgi:hypothetical protein
MQIIRKYPIIGAVIAQVIAVMLAVGFKIVLSGVLDGRSLLWVGLAGQGLVAAGLGRVFRLPVWWMWIGLFFPTVLYLALTAGHLPAWPFGIAFVVLLLFFSNTAGERVPLYLTNGKTVEALRSLMKERGARHFIDLGSGLGGVVRALDGEGMRARGVETAPMVWFVSMVLSKLSGRGDILRQDLWSTDLSGEDVVYAFLSPEPMPRLWEKAQREMKHGSVLVSNSFAVPGVSPTEIWELSDRRKTRLLLYTMGVPSAQSEAQAGATI